VLCWAPKEVRRMRGWAFWLMVSSVGPFILGSVAPPGQTPKAESEAKKVPKVVSLTFTGYFLNTRTGEVEKKTLKVTKSKPFPPAPWEPLDDVVYEGTLVLSCEGKVKGFRFFMKYDEMPKLGSPIVKVDGEEWEFCLTLTGRFINTITKEVEEATVEVTSLGWLEPVELLVDEVYSATLTITIRSPEGSSTTSSKGKKSSISFKFFVKFMLDGLDVSLLLSTDGRSWHLDLPIGHYEEWDLSFKTERDKYGRLWLIVYGTNTKTGDRREFFRYPFTKPHSGALVVIARRGEDGKPLGGAQVIVYKKDKKGKLVEVGRAVTNGRGMTEPLFLRAGKYVVDISYPMRCHLREEVEVKRGKTAKIGFPLYPHYYSVTIKVTFMDPKGKPAPWGIAELRWWPQGQKRPESPGADIGLEGEYTVMLGPGDWLIEAKCVNTGETKTLKIHIEEHQHFPLPPVSFVFTVPCPGSLPKEETPGGQG